MEEIECSETSEQKIQMPVGHPKEGIQLDICQNDAFQGTAQTKSPLLFLLFTPSVIYYTF
jgi:hypothetical protein